MAKQQTAPDTAAHTPGVRKGEEHTDDQGREAGRYQQEQQGARRPVGKSTPRDATSINPDDRRPIDPESPYLIPA
jgi:hypothetical protein